MTVDLGAIPELPLDEAYMLTAAFKADEHPQKVILGAGVYKDENGKPWILPSVREVSRMTESACVLTLFRLSELCTRTPA